jgi:ABC-type multidrug transport system fused ATPase/permease subunit
MNKVEEAAHRVGVHSWIASLPQDYDTPVGERGSKLSGGQRQRVGLARAFYRNPRLIVLDEALSALDGKGSADVREELCAMPADRTALVIVHDLRSARSADRILVLENGKIAEEGPPAELLSQSERCRELLALSPS